MSALFIAKSPQLFPDPDTFKPDRWLVSDLDAGSERLEQYILAFGKGTRSCVGINLAHAEMYTILATIFRKFPHIKLHNTMPRDVELIHDYFAGMTRAGSQGLQVVVARDKSSQM